MAKSGRKVKFHGAFKSKDKARAKEARTPGAFIREYTIRGSRRYVVMSERKR